MKKILSVILFAAVFFSFGVCSFGAESSEISFITSGPDENGNVIVEVVLSGGEPAMLQFCVAYDSEKLECVSANAGSVFSGNLAPLINITDGKIYFVWDSLNPLKNGGTLLRIEFSQKAGGSASVWIDETEDFYVADENFEETGVIGEKTEIGSSASSESGNSESSENSSSSVTSESSVNSESSSDSSNSETSDNSEQESISDVPETEDGYSKGIKIEKTQLTVKVGEETVIGISGTDEEVFWYSSNESVVIVEDGKIIPVGPGTATVTVMEANGFGEAACVVTVLDEEYSKDESSIGVIEAGSPRKENEEAVPAWAWIAIVLLGAGIAGISVLLIKRRTK